MKLIKLVSSENLTESTFTNQFSTPLVLNPKCEVALKSLTMEFDAPSFIIDSTNNQFSFKTRAGANQPTHVVNITNGRYANLGLLLKEIQNKMNNILDSKNETGVTSKYFQWRISSQESTSGNLNVSMQYMSNKPDETLTDANTELYGVSVTGGVFSKDVADDNNKYNAAWFSIVPTNKGGFQNTITLGGDENIDESNWIWGCDRSFITRSDILKDEIIAGMWFCMANSNGKYSYKKGITMIETTIPIEAADVLQVYKENGKIYYSITKGTNPAATFEGDVINTSILNLGSENAQMCFHFGSDAGNITASVVKTTPDPFFTSTNGVYTVTAPEEFQPIFYNSNLSGLNAPPSRINVFVFMPIVGIRKLLGFARPSYEIEGVTGSLVSDNGGVSINLVQDDLEVEIIEMPLDTYTETYRQKRNMIMSLSNGDLRGAVIASGNGKYSLSWSEPANFVFIGLNNEQHPLTFPALTVRITSAGVPIEMSGRITALILYQNIK